MSNRETEKQRKSRLRLELMHLTNIVKPECPKIDNSEIIDKELIQALKFIVHLSNERQSELLIDLLQNKDTQRPWYIDEQVDLIFQKQNESL